MKKRLFSGIQPDGHLHLGNYLGSIKSWVKLQDEYECLFCVVDLHAMTVEYDVQQFRELVFETAALFVACGVDAAKSTIFLQSQVPEHTELAWILDTITPMALLERMTQYKDKAKIQRQNVNVGLFNYPVLQAADILLYKAETVPVGEDQCQHLEMTRDIARRFNNRFGVTFAEPQTVLNETPRILGLDGVSKMSKSLNNGIRLLDPPDVVDKKIRSAVTDPARKRREDAGNPNVCNIFSLHKIFSTSEQIATIERECACAGIGCVDCKKMLIENLNGFLAPVQSKFLDLKRDPGIVDKILKNSLGKARPIAMQTMAEVRAKTGLRPLPGS
ncbi:MAG: tryptophan--tRNA ligase [Planctomycetota bacterium]